MSKNNLKEEVEWLDRDHAKITITDTQNVLSGEKVVGVNNNTATAEATYEDLKINYDIKCSMLEKSIAKAEKTKSDIARLPKKPVKTAEMIRLSANMNALALIAEHDKLEGQLKENVSVVEKNQHFVDIRKVTFALRPEAKK